MRGVTAYPEDLYQIVKLAMDVAYYCDWCTDVNDVAFTHEKLLCLFADFFQKRLSEELLA